jgi:hypothetical protein
MRAGPLAQRPAAAPFSDLDTSPELKTLAITTCKGKGLLSGCNLVTAHLQVSFVFAFCMYHAPDFPAVIHFIIHLQTWTRSAKCWKVLVSILFPTRPPWASAQACAVMVFLPHSRNGPNGPDPTLGPAPLSLSPAAPLPVPGHTSTRSARPGPARTAHTLSSTHSLSLDRLWLPTPALAICPPTACSSAHRRTAPGPHPSSCTAPLTALAASTH